MKLPERYIIGQEYFNDTERVDIKITCHFNTSVVINPFEFKLNDCHVRALQTGGYLIVIIGKQISQKLYESLDKDVDNVKFIIGYLDEVLQEVNKHLADQKYLSGLSLSKAYSSLDIESLVVSDSVEKTKTTLNWPIVITPFPPAKSLAPGADHIFIRDYLDSTTCYFTYNFDECIRKIITSLENYFHRTHIRGIFKNKFNDKLSKSLNPNNYLYRWAPYLNVLRGNIRFIYKIRNKIVHDKLRLDFTDRWVCKKGIGTLSYIYQSRLINEKSFEYIAAITQQFLMLDGILHGYKLDELSKADQHEGPVIKDPGELDAFFFNGLKISKKEKKLIMRKLKS